MSNDTGRHQPVLIDRQANPGLPERAYERCTVCYCPQDHAIHQTAKAAGK